MSNPTFLQISGAVAAAVATNGTITLAYPAGQSSSTVKAAGAKMFAKGLGNMLIQGTGDGTFSIAYGGSIVITYLGSTSIPAGSGFDFFLPTPDAEDAITDSTGGAASLTVAAITAGASYAQADLTALKNGMASVVAEINKLKTALKNANINPV